MWISRCGHSQTCHLVGPLLSNNITELCAVYLTLCVWEDKALHIHTDSRYVLSLVHGNLLAMERDSWTGLPSYFVNTGSSFSIHSYAPSSRLSWL